MKLSTVKIDTLIPDPDNARSHSTRNIKLIAESLDHFGQRKPIVVTPEKIVLAGNGTLEAALLLNWTEIRVVTIPGDWTPEQRRAFAIADNRTAELARWNTPLLSAQLERLETEGFAPAVLGFDLSGSPEAQQNPTREIDVDEFNFEHQCPACEFEFNER